MIALSDGGKVKVSSWAFVPPQKIACGNTHTLCLLQDSTKDGVNGSKVFGWGGNRNKQLGLTPQSGDGDKSGKSAERFEASTLHVPSEDVFCKQDPTGNRDPGSLLDIFEVACGSNHSMVLERLKTGDGGSLKDSRLWSFGLNANGQLGRSSTDEFDTSGDTLLPGEVFIPAILGNTVVVQRVCCGTDHTLVIANFVGQSGTSATVAGRVFAWGLASYGALGTRVRHDTSTPNEVWFPSDIFDDDPLRSERRAIIKQVAAGLKHSVALGVDGTVYTWGHGGNGRLGLGHTVSRNPNSFSAAFEPTCVDTLRQTKIKYIAVGEAHSGAVDQLGGLHTWGQGSQGRCGHGMDLDSIVPTRVESLIGVAVQQIALGLMHSIATTMKGQLYSWGKGPATGLDESSTVVPTPRLVEMTDRDPVYQIAAGPLHSVVLMCDGTLYCFGAASEGRMPFKLPGGIPKDQTFPKKVEKKGWSLEHEKAMEAGTSDKAEALGDSVSKDHDWWPEQICSGGANSAVLLEGGQTNLWFWGSGTLTGATEAAEGQNTQNSEHTWEPGVLKRGFQRAVRMVAIGSEHCLAITTDGQMYSWGNGDKGRLGTGNLRGVVHPQPIGHPTDVIYVSAGEEHSACIIEGGESYVWGNAEGGRLGLGNCLSEGIQLMPKQVVITDTLGASAQAVLVKSVACGSQHTAFISEDHRLLTFGMGWFGRLGHGNLDNQYSPHFVRSCTFGINSVHCGTYHTCIIDQSNVLWVCGRDNCICRDDMGHQKTPMQFEPFAQEPRRYVQSLATSEEHTLAITLIKGSTDAELWVWGKNNRGQLGLPAAAAPRIDTPWRLHIPDLERHHKHSYELRAVSTAVGHSLCLAILKKHSAKTQKYTEEPMLYAWGYSGSGRLGLVRDAAEKLRHLHELGVENSQLSGSQHAPVFPPMRVDQKWKPEEMVRRHTGRMGDQGDDGPAHAASRTWYETQLKLFFEPPDQKPRSLEDFCKEVSGMYEGFLHDVLGFLDKPQTGSDIMEYNLRQKQREIETEYFRSLNVLGLGMLMCAPRIEGRVKTEEEVLQRLHHFEKLVWVLQQQPLYLANLASCLWGKKEDDPEARLFYRVTGRLYSDLRDERTLHLFKALLRVMIESEVCKVYFDELFDPTKSQVAVLFTQMCTSIHFIERLAMPIVDPERESSLISIVIRYTISKDGKTPRNYKATKSQPDFSGVFVSKFKDYQNLLAQYRAGGGEKGVGKEESKRSRQHFANELRGFKELCSEEISDFLRRFIKETLKKEADIRMLLVCAFTNVTQRGGNVIQQRAATGDSWKPGICSPITALVLACALSGVLNAVHNEGTFSLIRLKIRQQVRRRESEMIDKWNANEGKKEDCEVESDIDGLLLRVFFNIQALANFFRRVVAPKGYAEFGKDGSMEKEEPVSRDCTQMLYSLTNETLLEVLQEHRPGSKLIGQSREFEEDVTETQLMMDLYAAHLCSRRTVIWFTTEEMLELSNLLWKYTKVNTLDSDGFTICLDEPENDEVYQLLKAILPVQKQKGAAVDGGRVPWSPEGHLWLAHEHGEAHNLTLPVRFLEFPREGMDEPTFCEVSQVAIPAFMARGEQKALPSARALRPFRKTNEEKGPEGAYEELEELMQDLAGNSKQHGQHSVVRFRINGRTFLELQSEFQEFQHQIAQDVEEGREPLTMNSLLQRLEDGKRIINRIRESEDEQAFRTVIDRAVRKREEYHQFLVRAKAGADEIQKIMEKYKEDLKRQYAYLSHLYNATVTCDIPEEILSMAQQYTERLAFERAKVKKSRLRRNHPTPSQRVLESLKNESKDGKITDELRDKVGVPARTFQLRELEHKGVIVRMHEKVPVPVQQQMCFTFQFKDEGYVVQAFMKTTLFKEFTISRQDIQLLQAGRKAAVMPYGGELLWVNCFRLLRLLASIYAEGGL